MDSAEYKALTSSSTTCHLMCLACGYTLIKYNIDVANALWHHMHTQPLHIFAAIHYNIAYDEDGAP